MLIWRVVGGAGQCKERLAKISAVCKFHLQGPTQSERCDIKITMKKSPNYNQILHQSLELRDQYVIKKCRRTVNSTFSCNFIIFIDQINNFLLGQVRSSAWCGKAVTLPNAIMATRIKTTLTLYKSLACSVRGQISWPVTLTAGKNHSVLKSQTN